MKNPVKIFIITYAIFMLLSIFFPLMSSFLDESNNTPWDYARITDVDYTAKVVDEPGCKGKVIITERLTYDIHAASKDNLFWELWRDLPENTVDGVKVQYKVNSVKQVFKNKPDVIYKESSKLYWNDSDYLPSSKKYGPGKWFHSKGPYNEDRRQYECVLFYVDGLYREKVTFEIEYEMINATLHYNDCSELYLSLYSGDTIKYLNSFKGQILFPNDNMPSEGNYETYTYGTNSHTFPITESTTKNPGYHTFSFELDKEDLKFRPYNQYIEFSLISYGEDKHVFSEYASRNNYYKSNVLDDCRKEQKDYQELPKQFKTIKLIILFSSSALAFLIIKSGISALKKMKKKYTFYEPTTQIDYFRDIPSNLDPNFASTLVFCKHKIPNDIKDGYAAIMLSLIRKDYIELAKIDNEKDWTNNNIKIIVKYKPVATDPMQPTDNAVEQKTLEPLTTTEELYFKLIVRHSKGTEITMKAFQSNISSDYEYTNSFVESINSAIPSIGYAQKYFQKTDYKEPKRNMKSKSTLNFILGIVIILIINFITYRTRLDLAFGAFFILGISFIIKSLYLRKYSKKGILLTQFGEDEYQKWRGLYNFLNSETLMNERTVIELPLWEQYLVYATAFGISDKVIAALNIRCPEFSENSMLGNPYYRSTSFHMHSSSFKNATRTATRTAYSRSYGGYGGHGGYGGGGRGGGGGGGGH